MQISYPYASGSHNVEHENDILGLKSKTVCLETDNMLGRIQSRLYGDLFMISDFKCWGPLVPGAVLGCN